VPEEKFAVVRNALLHTLYTAASEEGATILTSEPNYSVLTSAVPTSVTDVPTAPVKNPAGGGFDGQCIGAKRYRSEDDVSRHNPEPFLVGSTANHDPGDEDYGWKPGRDLVA
jgi:hypothetical protein